MQDISSFKGSIETNFDFSVLKGPFENVLLSTTLNQKIIE